MEESFRGGLYSPEMTARTYEELRRRAAAQLAAGRAVVIDATHASAAERARVLALAGEHGVPALIVELRLDDGSARARSEGRADGPLRTSDATW